MYVGIDVWGRGTNSGGGYNTINDVALIAKQGLFVISQSFKGLSCALFAPGWIFEHEFSCHMTPEYIEKEREFWNSTITSVTEEGRVIFTKNPKSIVAYVMLISAVICRVEKNRLGIPTHSVPTFR